MLKDGALLLLAKLLSMGSGMIITIFVARYFGVDVYGQYTTALAFVSFILAFTDFGTDTYMLKECSIDKANLSIIYSNSLLIKIIVLGITSLLIICLANILNYGINVYKLILLIIPQLVINYLVNTYFVIMQIEQKLSQNAIIQIIQTFIMLVFVGITLAFKLNIFIYATLQILLSLIILSIYLKLVKVKFTPTFNYSKIIIKGSIFFGLSSLLYIIYYKLDTVMLSIIKGSYYVGIYESAYKVISVLISLIVILDNIFLPKFFSLYEINLRKMLELYKSMLLISFILSIPLCFVFMNFSEIIIKLLYGNEYLDASLIFKILIWSVAIRLMAAIVGFVVTASNNMKIKVKFQFMFAIMNIILNLILIPLYGIIGAAISTILTEFMVLFFYYYFIKVKFKVYFNKKLLVKVLVVNFVSLLLYLIIKTPYQFLNCILYIGYYVLLMLLLNFKNIRLRFKENEL